jgi:hypothetical protein
MKSKFADERRVNWGGIGLSNLVAGFALCAALALSAFAEAPPGDPNGSDDETVGTLPGVSGPGIDLSRTARDASPALFIEGPLEQIFAMVDGVAGYATVTEEVIDASARIGRLTFHGDLRVVLDRQACEAASIHVGWTVPRTFGPARLTMLLDRRTVAQSKVSGRNVALPVEAMDAAGAFNAAPVTILAAGQRGQHATLQIVASGEQLVFTQSH